MKKVVLFILTMMYTVSAVADDSGSCGNNLTWTFESETGTLTISGTGAMNDYTGSYTAYSPWYKYRDEIKKIDLGAGLTHIGNFAFWYCGNITSISFPNSVASIGKQAFFCCSGLTSLTIPSSVSSIGVSAFGGCSSITDLTIPNSITTIDNGVFAGCKSLTSLTIPSSVSSIGANAFGACSGLTSLTIPNSVTSIGEKAFAECIALTSVSLPNGITSIANGLFRKCSNLCEIAIPNGVTTIGEYAFSNCTKLVSVIIPEGVISIGKLGFENCTGLKTISIPNSMKTMEQSAFEGCNNLTSVHISNLASWCSISFSNGSNMGNPLYIAHHLFLNDKEILELNIPDGVTSISPYAFVGASSISSLSIPETVTSIGDYAFYSCSALTNVSLPDNLESIGGNVFWNCTSLDHITIPKSVNSIGQGAFRECSSLQEVIMHDGLKSIGGSAFGKCTNIYHITIPESVNSIGESAFYGCSNLQEAILPDGLTNINRGTFHYCKNLKHISIPRSVTSIGDEAFYGSSALETVVAKMESPVTISGSVFTHREGNIVYAAPKAILYVPDGSEAEYSMAAYWKDFKEILPISLLEDAGCDLSDLPTDNAYYASTAFLCDRGVLSGSKIDGKTAVEDPLKRAHLAKIAFRGLYLTNGGMVPTAVPSDNYPTVYTDLTDKTAYYYQAARALMYLEYGDGVTPFDRNRLSFEPEENIARVHTLKVLMEAFDIQPDLEGTTNPFPADADVTALAKSNPRLMGYVRRAAALGIITTANSTFRPYDDCLRGEAFVMLARIMQKIEAKEIADPQPQESDYFEPLNTTLKTIALGAGLQMGNFQHYTKTSFALSGVMPLGFEHSYNSYNTTLPSVFYGDKSKTDADESYLPLGDGWSHSYHSFVTVVGEYSSGTTDNGLRVIVHWGGGSIDVYKSNGSKLVPESMGVYDEMEYAGGNKLTIKSKSQISYTFSKQGSSGAAVFYLSSVKDRNGNTLTINYENGQNGSKRISSVSDGHRSLRFSYLSGTDLLSAVKDPLNRSVKFTYFDNKQTGKKQLKSFTDAEGNTTTYEYADLTKAGTSKLLARIQLPKGNYVENEYDANCRLKNTARGQNGVPATKTSVSVAASYGSDISTKSQVDVERESGTSTYNFSFNGNNAMTGVTGELGMFVNSSYGSEEFPELPTSIQSNNTNISNVNYDSKGNVTSITVTGDGSLTTRMTYDEMNNLTSITDPKGNKTTYSYDSKGNLIGISAPENVTASVTVDSKGLPIEVSNPMGVKTEYDYNEYGNLVKTTLPALGLSSIIDYDAASRMTSYTDALGRISSYVYNNNDFLTSETDPMGHTTQYAYDKNGNLTSITNAKGGVTTMTYDNTTDWLRSVEFAGAKRQYNYNEDGTLSSLIKPDGAGLDYVYDQLGHLTGDCMNHYYYDDHLRLKTIEGSDKTLTISYDGFNRITGTSCDGHSNSYSYDANGNCTSINDTQYGYDGLNRLTKVSFGGKTINYTYRKDSQLSKVKYPNGMTTTFGYDKVGRLTSKQTKLSNGTVVASYTFALDKVGNITEQTMTEPYGDIAMANEKTCYSYNDGNRITKAGDISFSFDANGNTKKRGGENYSWDSLDRLTKAGSTALTYEPLGLIASYGDITFTTNPLGMGYVLSDSKSGAEYIYGNGLEARIIDGKVSYYVTDCRGSVIAIVDDNGNITHKYQYDEFGRVTQKEEADYNPFQYVGKYGVMALDNHLYYMRARHYDPTIGRFLSEDPIWSTNLYPYASNNPIMGIDPDGNKEHNYTNIDTWRLAAVINDYQRQYNSAKDQESKSLYKNALRELVGEIEKREDFEYAVLAQINSSYYLIHPKTSQVSNKKVEQKYNKPSPVNNPYENYSQTELEALYNVQDGQSNRNSGKTNIQMAIKNQSDYTEMEFGKTGSIRGISTNPENWLDIIQYTWEHRSEWFK